MSLHSCNAGLKQLERWAPYFALMQAHVVSI